MKNLIRNGGFERGTIDFWTAYDEKSFAVVATPVHKGSYAGKLVCDGSNNPYIMPNDYIEMGVGEVAAYEASLRANGIYVAYLRVEYYDEGLALIETVTYNSFNPGTTGYAQILECISGVEGAIYCRPYLYLSHSTLDDYMLIDNVQMYKLLPEEVMGGARLMDDRENISSSGSYFSPWSFVQPFKEAEFKLYCSSCTGTNETLDVKIVSRDGFHGLDRDIATFTQVTASDNLQTIVISEGLGTKIRVEAVVGGNPTDIDYYVVATFKR